MPRIELSAAFFVVGGTAKFVCCEQPVEVIKEVITEVIVEKPVEVIVEKIVEKVRSSHARAKPIRFLS